MVVVQGSRGRNVAGPCLSFARGGLAGRCAAALLLFLLLTAAAYAQAPTASFSAVSSPRTTPIASLSVTFSKTVTGVTKTPFSLTRNGSAVSLSSALLTGSGANYALSGLSSLTSPDGTYVLTLTAAGSGIKDASNNLLTANASTTWAMDTLAPNVAVNKLATTSRTPTLTGTTNDIGTAIASVKAVVNGATYDATVAGPNWSANITSSLADGYYNVAVTATDSTGHTKLDSTSNELVVDTAAPTNVTAPTTYTSDSSPALAGTFADLTTCTVKVSVNNTTYTAIVPRTNHTTIATLVWSLPAGAITALPEGAYTYRITATDATAHRTSPIAGALVVDRVSPTVTVDDLLANSATPLLTGTVNDGAGSGATQVQVTVADNTYPATFSNTTHLWSVRPTASLAEGSHTVSVVATDRANNASSPVTGQVVVDTTPPVITVLSPITNNRQPVLSGTVSDATADVRVSVAGRSNLRAINVGDGTWLLPASVLGTISADGTYPIQVSAQDAAGNTGQAIGSLMIQTGAPTGSIASLTTNDRTPLVSVTAHSSSVLPITSVLIHVNGFSYAAVSTPSSPIWTAVVTTPLAPDGAYPVTADITDYAGNIAQATGSLILDTTPPTGAMAAAVTSLGMPNLTVTNVLGTGSAVTSVTVTVNGATYTASHITGNNWTASVTSPLSDGLFPVTAQIRDFAGNVGQATGSVLVDQTQPDASIPPITTNENTPTVYVVGVDGTGTTITEVTVFIDGVPYSATPVSPTTTTWSVTVSSPLPDGSYTVSADLTDAAGNMRRITGSLTIDTVAPTITGPLVTLYGEKPVVLQFDIRDTRALTLDQTALDNAVELAGNGRITEKTVTAVSAGHLRLTITVAPTRTGSFTLTLPVGLAKDPAGSPTPPLTFHFTYDPTDDYVTPPNTPDGGWVGYIEWSAGMNVVATQDSNTYAATVVNASPNLSFSIKRGQTSATTRTLPIRTTEALTVLTSSSLTGKAPSVSFFTQIPVRMLDAPGIRFSAIGAQDCYIGKIVAESAVQISMYGPAFDNGDVAMASSSAELAGALPRCYIGLSGDSSGTFNSINLVGVGLADLYAPDHRFASIVLQSKKNPKLKKTSAPGTPGAGTYSLAVMDGGAIRVRALQRLVAKGGWINAESIVTALPLGGDWWPLAVTTTAIKGKNGVIGAGGIRTPLLYGQSISLDVTVRGGDIRADKIVCGGDIQLHAAKGSKGSGYVGSIGGMTTSGTLVVSGAALTLPDDLTQAVPAASPTAPLTTATAFALDITNVAATGDVAGFFVAGPVWGGAGWSFPTSADSAIQTQYSLLKVYTRRGHSVTGAYWSLGIPVFTPRHLPDLLAGQQ